MKNKCFISLLGSVFWYNMNACQQLNYILFLWTILEGMQSPSNFWLLKKIKGLNENVHTFLIFWTGFWQKGPPSFKTGSSPAYTPRRWHKRKCYFSCSYYVRCLAVCQPWWWHWLRSCCFGSVFLPIKWWLWWIRRRWFLRMGKESQWVQNTRIHVLIMDLPISCCALYVRLIFPTTWF